MARNATTWTPEQQKQYAGCDVKTRKIKISQRKFIKNFMEEKDIRKSMIKSGYSNNTVIVDSPTSSPVVRSFTQKMLEEAGISDEQLIAKLVDGLNATTTVFAQNNGIYTDERTIIDYKERREMLKVICSLRGLISKESYNIDYSLPGSIKIVYENRPVLEEYKEEESLVRIIPEKIDE